jgi:hypothetical protein
MGEERASVSSRGLGIVAAHERWAYGEGWIAGLDEGKRVGFDEGYDAGFDVGAHVGASRLLAALKDIVRGRCPDLLHEQYRRESAENSRRQHPEEIL